MILIGLTGGIGCGKSEVSRLLQKRGAVIVDADLIVRELQQPGQEIFVRMVKCWATR
ncbi:dephospho-CoA kinase [Acidimicrobiaceae bacterium]|nr:dephospho-CoA kinase [Acidimicrobiaceae bacterium]